MSRTLAGVCWAQIVPKWNWYNDQVVGVTVVRVTQRRPRRPQPGAILVRLTVTVPAAAFVPPVTDQQVVVQEGQYEPVTVDAGP